MDFYGLMHQIEKDFLIAFGNNLRILRNKKNITQHQLAIDTDTEISQISRIERGVINTSINSANNIAKALDVKITELFNF